MLLTVSSRPSDQKLPKKASSELHLCLFAYWCFLRGPTWSFCIILREENSKTADITQNAHLAGKKNSARKEAYVMANAGDFEK